MVKIKNKKSKKSVSKELDIKNSDLVNPHKLKTYVYGKQFPILSAQKISTIWNKSIHKDKLILVRMYLRIGKYTEYLIKASKPFFEYSDGIYVIDSNMIIDDLSSGTPTIFYHQDCSLPLSIKPNGEKIIETVKDKAKDIYRNVNPLVLKNTVMADVIEKVTQGARLEKKFLFILIVVIINSILTLFLLISFGVFFI